MLIEDRGEYLGEGVDNKEDGEITKNQQKGMSHSTRAPLSNCTNIVEAKTTGRK